MRLLLAWFIGFALLLSPGLAVVPWTDPNPPIKQELVLWLDAAREGKARSSVQSPGRPRRLNLQAEECRSVFDVAAGRQRDAVLVVVPTGSPRIIPKAEIVEMTASPVSLMPVGYDQALGSQGLKDLLTFLMLPPPAESTPSTP